MVSKRILIATAYVCFAAFLINAIRLHSERVDRSTSVILAAPVSVFVCQRQTGWDRVPTNMVKEGFIRRAIIETRYFTGVDLFKAGVNYAIELNTGEIIDTECLSCRQVVNFKKKQLVLQRITSIKHKQK
jgi:hypothetical protein